MRSDPTPLRWRLDGPVLLFALVLPSLATWLYFIVFAGRGAVMAWTYAICKVVQFALPVVWVIGVCGDWPEVRRLFARRGLALGIAFGVAVFAGMMLVFHGQLCNSPIMAQAPAQIWSKIAAFGIQSPTAFLGMALFYSGIHSFLEEYYWRWFVFGQLRRALPVAAAVTVSSIGFASPHVILLADYLPAEHFWTATIFFSFCVAVGGAVWAWLYHRFGSLLAPWLSHMLVDAALMWIGFVLCRRYFS